MEMEQNQEMLSVKDLEVSYGAINAIKGISFHVDQGEIVTLIEMCIRDRADMAQRIETAQMLLAGKTYEQIVKSVEISTATISRINRCIQYGTGGYEKILARIAEQGAASGEEQ